MTQASLAQRFADNGFVFPIRAIAANEIANLPGRFERELLPVRKVPTQETDYTFQTHLLFLWHFDVVSRKGRDMARLVRGEDRHGNFELAAARAEFDAKAVAVHGQASRMRQAAVHAANRTA